MMIIMINVRMTILLIIMDIKIVSIITMLTITIQNKGI